MKNPNSEAAAVRKSEEEKTTTARKTAVADFTDEDERETTLDMLNKKHPLLLVYWI